MTDFDMNINLGEELLTPEQKESLLKPCEYKCQHCDGEVVYYDDGNWRHFTCMSCKSMSPLSPAALILSVKTKPSKTYAKLRREGVIKRGRSK